MGRSTSLLVAKYDSPVAPGDVVYVREPGGFSFAVFDFILSRLRVFAGDEDKTADTRGPDTLVAPGLHELVIVPDL